MGDMIVYILRILEVSKMSKTLITNINDNKHNYLIAMGYDFVAEHQRVNYANLSANCIDTVYANVYRNRSGDIVICIADYMLSH